MDFKERYNIAPTQEIPAVVSNNGGRELLPMRWGLIPSWAKDGKTNSPLINARSETIQEKPSFTSSFKSKRCLIPADGFYEWIKSDKAKIPYHIHLVDNHLFAFAGIWAEWKNEKESIQSAAIITTEANSLLKKIHERMPVILSPTDYGSWLAPSTKEDTLTSLLRTGFNENLVFHQVSKKVNSYKADGPDCIVPV